MPKRKIAAAAPHKTPIGGITDRELIRELFVKRKPEYSLDDARRLTRTAEAEISAAIEAGEIAPLSVGDGCLLSWDDVAELALRRWTPRMIDGALDVVHRDAVPRLNRVRQIQAQLPLYQIRLLHYLAEIERGRFRARLNASDVLERHLLDLAGAVNADVLELAVPGFRAALHYPYFIPRDDDWSTALCWYCGRVSDVPGRQVCTDCHRRHEPRPHLGEDGIPELDQEE